jgi:hypothetical protein
VNPPFSFFPGKRKPRFDVSLVPRRIRVLYVSGDESGIALRAGPSARKISTLEYAIRSNWIQNYKID